MPDAVRDGARDGVAVAERSPVPETLAGAEKDGIPEMAALCDAEKLGLALGDASVGDNEGLELSVVIADDGVML